MKNEYTCLPSGIAIIQLTVMAWVSLYQGYWVFLEVKSLQPPGVGEWQLSSSSSFHALLPPRLCTRQGSRTAGPWPLMVILSLGPRPAWTGRKGRDPGQQEGRHNVLSVMDHSSHWFQVLGTSLRDLSKMDRSTHGFCLLSQSFLLNSNTHCYFKMLASVTVNKYSHSVPVFCRWETMHSWASIVPWCGKILGGKKITVWKL